MAKRLEESYKALYFVYEGSIFTIYYFFECNISTLLKIFGHGWIEKW